MTLFINHLKKFGLEKKNNTMKKKIIEKLQLKETSLIYKDSYVKEVKVYQFTKDIYCAEGRVIDYVPCDFVVFFTRDWQVLISELFIMDMTVENVKEEIELSIKKNDESNT
jgi:hypothetical protein